jgi:hypothetical protein
VILLNGTTAGQYKARTALLYPKYRGAEYRSFLFEFQYLLKKAGERPEGFFESLVEPLKPSGRCSLSPKN